MGEMLGILLLGVVGWAFWQQRRQAELAKPPGSLGKLEDYSIRLAGITGQVRPHIEKCRVLVLAAGRHFGLW